MTEVLWAAQRGRPTTPVVPISRIPGRVQSRPAVPVKPALSMPVKKPAGISTTVFSIIRGVARKHDLTVPMIMGDSRHKPVVVARQEAIWRIWRERGYAFARIGRIFGKDHTTIMHSIAKHEERLAKAREGSGG